MRGHSSELFWCKSGRRFRFCQSLLSGRTRRAFRFDSRHGTPPFEFGSLNETNDIIVLFRQQAVDKHKKMWHEPQLLLG